MLKVIISNQDKINFINAKSLVKKARHIIKQNQASDLIIKINHNSMVDKSALEFFNSILWNNSSFPVAIINS